MEYAEVIAGIVALERRAREITAQARERQAAVEADAVRESAALLASYLERARRRLEEVERAECAIADESIAALDAEHARRMADLDAAFTAHGDDWAGTLFARITGDAP